MFTEKSFRTEPLREAAFAPSKNELTGCLSNTCPISSVCEVSETATAATAPAEESTSGHHSSEPRHGGGTRTIQRGHMNSLFFMLQPLFSYWKNKGAPVAADWILY